MKKRKLIFYTILLALITSLSIGLVSVFNHQGSNYHAIKEVVESEVSSMVLQLSIDAGKKPTLLIDDKEDLELTTLFQSNVAQNSKEVLNDKYLRYTVIDTKTHDVLSTNVDGGIKVEGNDSYFLLELEFQKDNTIIQKDRYGVRTYYPFREVIYHNNYGSYDDALAETYEMNSKLELPQDISFIIDVDSEVLNDSSSYLYNRSMVYNEDFMMYSFMGMSIGFVLLFVLILFTPMAVLKTVGSYQFISKQKALFTITVVGFISSSLGVAGIFLADVTTSGKLLSWIQKFFVIPYGMSVPDAKSLIFIVNVLTWMAFFYVLSLVAYYLKYMFADGFGRFLVEDTVMGSFLRFIKKTINSVLSIDLTRRNNLLIFMSVLGLMLMVAFLAQLGFIGVLLIMVLALALVLHIMKKQDEISLQYVELLETIRQIGNGNFNDISEDAENGLFKLAYQALAYVRVGFKEAVREEVKSQNMRTELLTNVSHDLKTPVTGIRNYVELLQNPDTTPEQRVEYTEKLNVYSNRLTTLIDDLFELSKVNSGSIQLNKEAINIVSLLEQVYAEHHSEFESRNLTPIWKIEDEIPSVELDGNKTHRIFDNIFTNVIKYSLENTRVYINVESSDKLIVEVKNIAKQQLDFNPDEIVERFVRGDKSRNQQGSGLGLSIVQSFTQAQDGDVKIETDGDLFKITLNFPI